MTLNRPTHLRDLALFVACAFGISWLIWLPAILGTTGLGLLNIELSSLNMYAGFWGPTLSALISSRVRHGTWRAFTLWSSWREMLWGVTAGALPILVACFASAALSTESGPWIWSALLRIPFLLGPNLLGGPLPEEPGWRGFALPRLQTMLGPAYAAVVLGVLWSTWHLPLFLVHFTTFSYWVYVPFLTSISVMVSYGFNRSGKSVVVAIFLHGLANVGLGVIMNDFLAKATVRQGLETEALLGGFVGVAFALIVVTSGRLGERA